MCKWLWVAMWSPSFILKYCGTFCENMSIEKLINFENLISTNKIHLKIQYFSFTIFFLLFEKKS
jgi:hypothetical protein